MLGQRPRCFLRAAAFLRCWAKAAPPPGFALRDDAGVDRADFELDFESDCAVGSAAVARELRAVRPRTMPMNSSMREARGSGAGSASQATAIWVSSASVTGLATTSLRLCRRAIECGTMRMPTPAA